jgi:glycosyltransferase involved in cell wall biosynthesis
MMFADDTAGGGRASQPRVMMIQTQAEGAGAQEISRLLSRELGTRGYDLTQIFLFRRTAAFDADPTARFCATERPRSLFGLLLLLMTLFREIRRAQPDVVVCFQHWGNIIGTIVARLAGVRLIVANENSSPSGMPRGVRRLDQFFGTIGLFSRVVVNSADTEADYRGYGAPYTRRLVRIDHGFEKKHARRDRASARAAFGLPANMVLLGCVSRLHPDKNQAAAIRLLAEEPLWHLALAGQGKSEAEYRALADSLGCRERLHFIGERSPAEIGDFLGALDIFVFPSKAETFGLAVVEAAEAGVPVVANDLPVLREVLAVEDGPCAVFVDVNDTKAFLSAVRSIVADPGAASSLSERGRRLGNRYPLSAMVDGYDRLIQDLAPARRAVVT